MSKHERIQQLIVSTCKLCGIEAIQEYAGKGWRADVFIPNKEKPIAFEIQLSSQSLKKTLDRQAKYIRDEIVGCWFFETPVAKLNKERPDLPLFYVEESDDATLIVNLGDRKKVDLQTFLGNFISNKIQFNESAKTKTKQVVRLVFYEMNCWKCKAKNHLFYVDSNFYSACNAIIKPMEELWESSNIEYRPEIIELAQKFIADKKDLNLATIKNRFSNTVNKSYTSFGCYKCDSLFGDFYVMDAKMDVMYATNQITFEGEVELKDSIELPIGHWCFPEDNQFCCARQDLSEPREERS